MREGQGDGREAHGKGPASEVLSSGEEPEGQTRPLVKASEVLSRRAQCSFKAMTDGGVGRGPGGYHSLIDRPELQPRMLA